MKSINTSSLYTDMPRRLSK